jgi:hypothetical protein
MGSSIGAKTSAYTHSCRSTLHMELLPIRHELYEMAVVCPQPVQRSRCPPRAAVRQRAIASNTFRCCQLIHLRLRSIKDSPAQRTMSAISSSGRLMSCACVLLVQRR